MDLKVFYDDLVEKNAKVKEIGDQISELAKAGDKESAWAMKAELDEARAAAKTADEFYMAMVEATQVYMTGAAREFVPVSKEAKGEAKNVVDRAGFEAMDVLERSKFLAAGGRVTE